MTAPHSSLIARLRHRFAASAWLFAFLVISKVAVVTACLADESGGPASTETIAVVDDAVVHAASADSDSDACFHAGSGGCHCACAHASVLLTTALNADSSSVAPTPLPPVASQLFPAPRSTTLRPPIA